MDIFEQLRRDEGERLRPYTDTVGKVSIGVGRNLTDDGISKNEETYLLNNDVNATVEFLQKNLPWTLQLEDARKGAFINLAFGLRHRLLGFHSALYAAQCGNWKACAAALLDSEWEKEVGDRAHRLALQLETNVWV